MSARNANVDPVSAQSAARRARRARSARNAFRHGLSLPVGNDPALAPEIDQLTQQIAGAEAATEIGDRARIVAEAHTDVCRVRQARYHYMQRALAEHYETPELTKQKLAMLERWLSPQTAFAPMPQPLLDALALSSTRSAPEKWGSVLITHAKTLSAFDRYERRALSRRARAIELFDAARVYARMPA